MLPEFPALKLELMNRRRTIRRMVRASDPILAQVRTFTQHEGLNLRYERLQAAPIESGPQRIQIPVELRPEEVPTLVGEFFAAKLDGMAKVLVRQEMKHLFDKVERDSKEVGTALDAGGKPLTGEVLLDALSLAQEEFDEDRHTHSQIVIHPDMAPALKRPARRSKMTPHSSKGKRKSSSESEMSGVLERAIENWLTKVNERQYQLPFCQVLAARGEAILYVSTHGPFPKGKDIITRTRKGEINAYQAEGWKHRRRRMACDFGRSRQSR